MIAYPMASWPWAARARMLRTVLLVGDICVLARRGLFLADLAGESSPGMRPNVIEEGLFDSA